jgi:fatty acid desaturase
MSPPEHEPRERTYRSGHAIRVYAITFAIVVYLVVAFGVIWWWVLNWWTWLLLTACAVLVILPPPVDPAIRLKEWLDRVGGRRRR